MAEPIPHTDLILYYEYITDGKKSFPVMNIYQKVDNDYIKCQHHKFVIIGERFLIQQNLEDNLNKLKTCLLVDEDITKASVIRFQTFLQKNDIKDIVLDGDWGGGTWNGLFQFIKKNHGSTFTYRDQTFLVIDLNKIKDRLNDAYFNDVNNEKAADSRLSVTNEIKQYISELQAPVQSPASPHVNADETGANKALNEGSQENKELNEILGGKLEELNKNVNQIISKIDGLEEKANAKERAPLSEDDLAKIAELLHNNPTTPPETEGGGGGGIFDLIQKINPQYLLTTIIVFNILIGILLIINSFFSIKRNRVIFKQLKEITESKIKNSDIYSIESQIKPFKDSIEEMNKTLTKSLVTIEEKFQNSDIQSMAEKLNYFSEIIEYMNKTLLYINNNIPEQIKEYIATENLTIVDGILKRNPVDTAQLIDEKHEKNAQMIISKMTEELKTYNAIDDKPALPTIMSKLSELDVALKDLIKKIQIITMNKNER